MGGATGGAVGETRDVVVSIHAPVGGATENTITTQKKCSFNPRARRGRDDIMARQHQGRLRVSIHAPAGGATRTQEAALRKDLGFNPRARRGRDGLPFSSTSPQDMFQSTRPQGARLTNGLSSVSPVGFNPRARRGRDQRRGAVRLWLCCFNPRARRGRDKESV